MNSFKINVLKNLSEGATSRFSNNLSWLHVRYYEMYINEAIAKLNSSMKILSLHILGLFQLTLVFVKISSISISPKSFQTIRKQK
jgi:hypothetical protein